MLRRQLLSEPILASYEGRAACFSFILFTSSNMVAQTIAPCRVIITDKARAGDYSRTWVFSFVVCKTSWIKSRILISLN